MTARPPENILSDVGGRMAQLGEPGSTRYFLYLETEEGMQSPYLFQEFGDRVQYVEPTGIMELLYELWLDAKPQQWGAMRFGLDGDRFAVTFDYDIDPTDDLSDDRAAAAVKVRFGEKPVVYLSREAYDRQYARQAAMFDR